MSSVLRILHTPGIPAPTGWVQVSPPTGCRVNTQAKPIYVSSYFVQASGYRSRSLTVGGHVISQVAGMTYYDGAGVQGYVPPGATWCVAGSVPGTTWVYYFP